jgi:hypothetical protein
VFFTALTNNGDRENFFGAIVSTASTTQELTVRNLDAAGSSATLQLVIQGGTLGAHRVSLAINGHDAGTLNFKVQQRLTKKITVPLAWLANGANTLTLVAHEGDEDISVVESVELTYPHLLRADDDALRVTATAGARVSVSGFTTDRIRAFDVTDPASPIAVSVDVTANGAQWQAAFVAPGTARARSSSSAHRASTRPRRSSEPRVRVERPQELRGPRDRHRARIRPGRGTARGEAQCGRHRDEDHRRPGPLRRVRLRRARPGRRPRVPRPHAFVEARAALRNPPRRRQL